MRVKGLNRWEISPHVSGVVNDPFLNRGYAGVGIGYHLTEVFGIESMIDVGFPFSQCLEASAEGAQAQCPDDSGLTENLLDYNSVVPDISRIIYMGDLGLTYSPIYGKAAVLGNNIINFDLPSAKMALRVSMLSVGTELPFRITMRVWSTGPMWTLSVAAWLSSMSRRSAGSFLSLSKSAIAFLALSLMSTLLRFLRARIYASGVNYRGSIYF